MRERSLRAREVDQQMGGCRGRADVAPHTDTSCAAEALAGIAAREWARGNVERCSERELRIRRYCLDERLAHPAAGAGNRDPDHRHFLKMSMIESHRERGSPQRSSFDVRARASRFKSACDAGISSPSHRAGVSWSK